jgi:hypothetical protein
VHGNAPAAPPPKATFLTEEEKLKEAELGKLSRTLSGNFFPSGSVFNLLSRIRTVFSF